MLNTLGVESKKLQTSMCSLVERSVINEEDTVYRFITFAGVFVSSYFSICCILGSKHCKSRGFRGSRR